MSLFNLLKQAPDQAQKGNSVILCLIFTWHFHIRIATFCTNVVRTLPKFHHTVLRAILIVFKTSWIVFKTIFFSVYGRHFPSHVTALWLQSYLPQIRLFTALYLLMQSLEHPYRSLLILCTCLFNSDEKIKGCEQVATD